MSLIPASQPASWSAVDAGALGDQELLCGLAEVLEARSVLDGLMTRVLAQIDLRGLATQLGAASTGVWLGESGVMDHGPAKRLVGTATGLEKLPATSAALRGGEISLAHAAVIVGAIAAVEAVCPELDPVARAAAEEVLLTLAGSAAPHVVAAKGREILLALKPVDTVPPAEDVSRNRFDFARMRNGRTRIVGDVDAVTGEKLATALSPVSKPDPAQDGTPDARSASQRRADGFSSILDAYLGCGLGPGEGGVKPHLVLTAKARDLATTTETPPADREAYEQMFGAPAPFRLEWMGPVSREVARMLACDCTITKIILDDHEVPLRMGRAERLVPAPLRKALVVRDVCCVKCGAPAAWCQAHHVIFWADGGATDLGNLVLLCGRCHRLIHRGQWEVFIGTDGHAWLIPPEWIDKQRKPVPAFNRRTQGVAA